MTDSMTHKMAFEPMSSSVTRKMTVEELCIAAVPAGTNARIELVNVETDHSGSVGDSNLQSLFDEGIPAMIARIQKNSEERNRIAFVRIATFSNDVEVLLDWTNVASASEKAALHAVPKAKGVTRLDLAIRDGLDAIDRMKAAIDAHHPGLARGGAVNLVITDGRITDEHGNEIGVPDDLALEIAERQTSRATSSILLGIGASVSEEQLARLAPPTITKNGIKVPHAAMYKHSILFEDSEDEKEFWRMVSQLMADASSRNSTPGFNEAFMSLDDFEIVGV